MDSTHPGIIIFQFCNAFSLYIGHYDIIASRKRGKYKRTRDPKLKPPSIVDLSACVPELAGALEEMKADRLRSSRLNDWLPLRLGIFAFSLAFTFTLVRRIALALAPFVRCAVEGQLR